MLRLVYGIYLYIALEDKEEQQEELLNPSRGASRTRYWCVIDGAQIKKSSKTTCSIRPNSSTLHVSH